MLLGKSIGDEADSQRIELWYNLKALKLTFAFLVSEVDWR